MAFIWQPQRRKSVKEICSVIALVTLCFLVETSYAELIRYTDKNGTLCFVDDLGKVPARYRQNIIRDEEEIATQIINSQDVATKQNFNSSEVVHVCYSVAPRVLSINADHDVQDFLEARGYPYVLHLATDLESAKPCYELWCKWDVAIRRTPGRDFDSCIQYYHQKPEHNDGSIHTMFPFMYIGDKVFTHRMQKQLNNIIDEYFHTATNTPVVFKDGKSFQP
jgi:hypothetical protein